MSFDTFDTDSVATAGVTFTNGNLTAQGGAGASLVASMFAQTLEGKTSGKWYVEFTCVALSGNVDGVGVLTSIGPPIGATQYVGGDQRSYAHFNNNHVTTSNINQTAVNAATWTAGDVIGMAVDLDNKRIWWRKNTGLWVGTSGTPDPATNTSGFDLSTGVIPAGVTARTYPAVNLSGSAAKFTINTGGSAFTGTVPSGFNSGWTNTQVAGTFFGSFASGKSSVNTQAPPASSKSVSKWTATASGTVSSVVFSFSGVSGGTGSYKAVVYAADGTGGLPGTKLGVSAARTQSSFAGAVGEQTFTFSAGPSVVNGTTYWFGIVTNNASTSTAIVSVPLTTGTAFNADGYTTPSDPFGALPSTANTRYPLIVNLSPSAARHQLLFG